jgi:hypothetical protein
LPGSNQRDRRFFEGGDRDGTGTSSLTSKERAYLTKEYKNNKIVMIDGDTGEEVIDEDVKNEE